MRWRYLLIIVYLFVLFYFEQYLVRGAQLSEAGLNRALVKTKTTQKIMTDLKKNGTTKYSENIGGSIWLGSKVPFKAKPKLISIMLAPQGQ